MPRKTSGPKLFKCTGHGDCDMVFTRSEHLARHERKHTGEKPFKCIVPGCERMFSRYDNMMQHTHTHERQQESNIVRSRRSSMVQSRTLPPPPTTPQHPFTIVPPSHHQVHQVVAVPSPPLPQQEPREQEYFMGAGSQHHHHHPHSHYNSGGQPTYDYFNDPNVMMERNWHQGEWTPPHQSPPTITKRRLSAIDLQTPIEHWSNGNNNDEESQHSDHDMAVDVTPDEYEAIQGFGKFRQEPIIRSPESPRVRMQVNFFRQNSLPVQESFQRPTRSHAI
ncbi:hypothetical protein BDA99DRAFT_542984 [Phascolomyces articulosus]|uniref:C2H2-type domain-containing protein n=1 Tax=Phascolomyces articulosus TaxID=60185 RepID=A0AAD5JZM2_9FUNG|nr:hypothetical protein BDA99DRAFT_542984 [Phascolomyces articulosus]